MAPPRGQFGNRLDTEAGRAKEAAMQAAAAVAATGNAQANQMAAAIPNAPARFIEAVSSTVTQNAPATQPQNQEVFDPGVDNSAEIQAQADREAMARQLQQQQYETAMRQAEERKRVQNAIEVVKSLMTQYNLTSLYDKMVGYIKDGYEPDAVMVLIRTTPEYKQRFPAMEALAQKGRAISEAEYIEYERRAAQLEQMYGLPSRMLQDNVTGLLTNEVSADELQDRVVLASAASVTAPQQLKDTLKNYYGVDAGGLAGYFLDPAIATPILERQFATAVIGSEALRQDVNIGRDIAQNLQELGVTQEQAREGFGQVRRLEGLTRGKGDRVNQQQLISGTFGQEKSAREIERAQSSRRARFEAGGQYVAEQGGVAALGAATT